MPKFIWTEKNSVGVEEIDKQHQHFFALANEIIALSEQADVQLRGLLFKVTNLSSYAVYHLLTEEKIFKKYDYPDAKEHITAHDVYREKMKKLVDAVEKESPDTKALSNEMAAFAGDWLTNHIMAMDKKYVDFMHKNGIK